MLIDSGSLQVADAPLARQSSAASGKPALSAAAEALWRRRVATARGARTLLSTYDASSFHEDAAITCSRCGFKGIPCAGGIRHLNLARQRSWFMILLHNRVENVNAG